MTEKFDKFFEWAIFDKETCFHKIREDAPKEVKAEAKKADEEYYQKTGRHKFLIDY